jgi:hypothetical protein
MFTSPTRPDRLPKNIFYRYKFYGAERIIVLSEKAIQFSPGHVSKF